MSIKIVTQIWETSSQEGARLLLLVALADFATSEGWAWPSVPTLAKKSRLSERYVQILLKDIENSGEIFIEHGTGPNGVNRYHIHPGVYRFWPSPVMNTDSPVVNTDSPVPDVHPVNPDSPPAAPLITGVVNPCAESGEDHCTGGVNPNAPESSWNPQGTVMEPPPPAPSAASGPFENDWDPGDAPQVTHCADEADAAHSDDDGWGGGGEEEEREEIPVTVLKPLKRAILDRLVGVGGEWDAEQYERDTVAGPPEDDAPSSVPPQAANDISWAECEKQLRALKVEYPGYLRKIGLPYRAIVKKAKVLSNQGAGGGGIVNWFRNEANVDSLWAELANPDPLAAAAVAPEPPTSAQVLKQRPDWCSAEAWIGIPAALRVKLQAAEVKDGWLVADSRYQQKALDRKYRGDVIAILQQSGIQPVPPPELKAPTAPSVWRAA